VRIWAAAIKRIVQRIVHGDFGLDCLAHAETLRAMKPKAQVIVPACKQVVEI